jgi:hypothetical protein
MSPSQSGRRRDEVLIEIVLGSVTNRVQLAVAGFRAGIVE